MAVADEDHPEESTLKPKSTWRELATNPTIILTLAAVLWYSLLNISYSAYYEPLGVRPSDVGLTYASILASSIGTLSLVATIFGILFLTTGLPIALVFFSFRTRINPRKVWATILMVELAVSIGVSGFALIEASRLRSRHVQQGVAVTPPDFEPWPLGGLSIYAYPTTIVAVGEESTADGVGALSTRSQRNPPLLYLGQNAGFLIIYDSSAQQAIYAPAASIVLRTDNCQLSKSGRCEGALD